MKYLRCMGHLLACVKLKLVKETSVKLLFRAQAMRGTSLDQKIQTLRPTIVGELLMIFFMSSLSLPKRFPHVWKCHKRNVQKIWHREVSALFLHLNRILGQILLLMAGRDAALAALKCPRFRRRTKCPEKTRGHFVSSKGSVYRKKCTNQQKIIVKSDR